MAQEYTWTNDAETRSKPFLRVAFFPQTPGLRLLAAATKKA
jgi:hypothetical protein